MKQGPLVYYVTAHGYGHAARTCDIVRALLTTHPEAPIRLVTDLEPSFFRGRLDVRPSQLRAVACDTGMVQHDAVRTDVPASLDAGVDLLARRDALIERESVFLREARARLVVCDIPAIPIEAAHAAGIPSVAVGNFGWDWIYSGYTDTDARWGEMAAAYAAGYGKADLLLRLPFAEPMTAFPKRIDLPVVATPGRPRKADLARMTGARAQRRWVLLCFSGLDWSEEALDRVEALTDYEFFTVLPLGWSRRNLHAVSRDEVSFADVLASSDVVITKPGYGILSECVANRIPMIYADRTDFREYDVLVEAIGRYLCYRHIPAADLYAGNLGSALDGMAEAPGPREEIELGGDRIAADILHRMWTGA